MKNWKLRTQLSTGFAVALCFTVLVGVCGMVSLNRVLEASAQLQRTTNELSAFSSAKEQVWLYLGNSNADGREIQEQAKARAIDILKEALKHIQTVFVGGQEEGEQQAVITAYQTFLARFVSYTEHEQRKIELSGALLKQFEGYAEVLKAGAIRTEDMVANGNLLQASIKAYLERPSQGRSQELQAVLTAFDEAIEAWYTFVDNSERLRDHYALIRERADVINQDIADYRKEVEQQNSLLAEMDGAESSIKEGINTIVRVTDQHLEQVKNLARNIILMAIACAVVVGMLFAWLTTRAVTRPIGQITNGLKDVAEGEGDLTKRLTIELNNEVGELASWFNVFIEKINAMIRNVADNAEQLKDSSSSLTGIATEMSDGAYNASSLTRSVASAAEELSVTMNSVAAASEEAAASLELVASSADEMTSSVGEIATNSEKARGVTEEAVAKATSASQRVNQLGEAAVAISRVTEVITEISEQTNLLALNATIEAARAGEAGKGFAVVANEIKELAAQTARATLDIKSKIKDIQDSTGLTVSEIEEIEAVIRDVNETVAIIATAVEEQATTTREIAGNITQAAQGIAEVNQNVAQSSVVSTEIAQDIAKASENAEAMSNSSGQVKVNADELSVLAKDLDQVVARFKY